MRQIGHLEDEKAAHTFGDYLYVQGVHNQVEPDDGHGWAVWIHAEDDLERAAEMLEEFRARPAHPRFRAQAKGAAELRAQAEKEQTAYAKRMKTGRELFRSWYANGFGPVSVALMAASVVVFVLSRSGDNPEAIAKLFFSLPEILRGEAWRVVTPIFIHFGFIHIFFNLMWLRDLGGGIEWKEGPWRFALLVMAIAALSNTAQYFVSGPAFGGMSGVVYGLLGYVWFKGKFDPASGYFLHPSTVTMMIVWYVLCLTDLLGHVANTVHTVGLGVGCAWGWLSSLKRK